MNISPNKIWHNNQEEQLFKALNTSCLVSITDTKGVIIYANDAFCKISGYTEKELLGNTHSILKSGKQPERLFKDMWSSISSNKVWKGEICNKKKDGSFYWVNSTIIPFENELGHIEKYVSLRFDITNSKEDKSKLNLIQKKLKILFDATPEAFLIIDLNGQILECSTAAEDLFGYKKNELNNLKIRDLEILDDTDRTFLANKLKISSKKPLRSEFQITSKQGKQIDVEIVAHHTAIEGEPLVLIMIHNNTERKVILNKLREKTNDLSLLLYRSGHDLRTPFTSLEGLLNLIKEEPLNESTLDILDMFENVLTDGKRLIDNLSTSSIMLDKKIIKEEIDFNLLMEKTIISLSQIEGFHNINFNVNIPEDFKINSNLQLMSSMLQNIIQNAIKYQRPINAKHTAFIIINAFKTDAGFKICIKDNGIGINTNELDKVFNLYYRSNNTINGTGLGLYITKNIVEQLKGTIAVKSTINEMTQFDINLPNAI